MHYQTLLPSFLHIYYGVLCIKNGIIEFIIKTNFRTFFTGVHRLSWRKRLEAAVPRHLPEKTSGPGLCDSFWNVTIPVKSTIGEIN